MMKKTETEAGSTGHASAKVLRRLFGAAVVLMALCLAIATPVVAGDSSLEMHEYGAWLSTDTVVLGDVFYLNITGNPGGIAYMSFSSDLFTVIPNQNTVNSSGTGYVYIDLDTTGNQTIAFKAEGACSNYSFGVDVTDSGNWYYPEITVTAPAEGYLKLSAPKGLSLDAGDVWVYANYYNSTGYWQDDAYVTWKIDDKSVIGLAEMEDRSVRLSPRSTGTATLYAELSDNPLINASVEIPVEKTEVIRITGGHSSTTLSLGTTGSAWASAIDQFDKSFSYKEVEWSVKNGNVSLTSSDDDVYKVIISPISVGTDTITARSISNPELSWSFDVRVIAGTTNPDAGDADHVLLSYYGNTRLTVDAKPVSVSAYVRDEYRNTLHEEEIIWEVENESVAVVSVVNDINDPTHQAILTPKSKGTTILYAYSADKKLNDSIVIHVDDTIITSVGGPDFPKKTAVSSSTWGPHVYVYDQFGNQLPDEYVTITVSDGSVLTLRSADATGSSLRIQNDNYVFWTGLSPGTVTVTTTSVSNTAISETRTVTFEEQRVALISLQNYADRVLTTSSSGYISAKLEDQFGDTIYGNHDLVWTVVNESVLTVSTNNYGSTKLTPVAPGTTTIRVALKSDRTLYDEVNITVEETILSSIYLSGTTEMSLFSNGEAKAYVLDQVGNDIDSEKIGWKVDNPAILEIEPIWVNGNYDHYISISPKAVGSTKIHAYSLTDPSVTWNMTVSVLEPVVSNAKLVYRTDTLSMNTLGSVSVKLTDQFGGQPDAIEMYWTVDDASVLELSSAYSKYGREILLIPQKPGVVNLTVSPVGYPDITLSLQMTVVEGTATGYKITTSADSCPLGSAIILSGNTTSDYIYFYIQGNNLPLSPLDSYWVSDDDGSWEMVLSTASPDFAVTLDCGTYTIYAVEGRELDLHADDPLFGEYYGYASISLTDPILRVEVPEYIVSGTLRNISGTVTESASQVQAHVFGTNYYQKLSATVFDSYFTLSINAENLYPGQYFMVVQHPMTDGNFNIDSTADGKVYFNQNGAAVVKGVGVGDTLFDIYDRQSANAAYALCDAIDSLLVNDSYLFTSFFITHEDSGVVIMNPLESSVVRGNSLTVSGTSTEAAGTDVVVTIIHTDCAALPQEILNDTQFIVQNTTVSAEGTWSVTFDTSTLETGEYVVTAKIADFAVSDIIAVFDIPHEPIHVSGPKAVSLTSSDVIRVSPQNGNYLWSVEDETVLTLTNVSASSPENSWYKYIQPVSYGTTNITVTRADNPSVSETLQVTVADLVPSEIMLKSKSSTISTAVNGSLQVYVYDQFGQNIGADVTITSTNPSVATVTEAKYYGNTYVLSPVSVGQTVISATVVNNQSLTASLNLEVVDPVFSAYLSSNVDNISVNTEGYLQAYVYDQFEKTVSMYTDEFMWTVDNPDILRLNAVYTDQFMGEEISYQMKMTGLSPGTATITAIWKEDPTYKAEYTITVEKASHEGISASYYSEITLGVEETYRTIQAELEDQYGQAIVNAPLSFTVVNKSVISSVTPWSEEPNTYVLNPAAPGKTDLVVSVKDSAVEPLVLTITVAETKPQVHLYDDVHSLSTAGSTEMWVDVYDQYGKPLNLSRFPVTVTIDNPSIFSAEKLEEHSNYYDAFYHITPLAVGTANVTVTVQGYPESSAVCTITVEEPKPQITLGSTSHETGTLSKSAVVYVSADISDQFNYYMEPVDGMITWAVNNTALVDTEIVTVYNDSWLKITPKAEGSISVQAEVDGKTSAPLELVITEETDISYIEMYVISVVEPVSSEPNLVASSGKENIPNPPKPELPPLEPMEPELPDELILGEAYNAGVILADQFGSSVETGINDIIITADKPELITWQQSVVTDEGSRYLTPSYYPLTLIPQKAGIVNITVTSTANSSVTETLTLAIVGDGTAPVLPGGEAEVIVPPTISPKGGMLYKDAAITIETETAGATIYYTTDGSEPTKNSNLYTGPFSLKEKDFKEGKSLAIKAVAVKDGCADSTIVTEIYTHAKKDKPKHKVQVASVTGGSVTLSTTEPEADELVSLTFKADSGYQLAGWNIIGNISGDYSSKSGTINDFAMWDEDVIIVPDFIQIVDQTPKPTAIKFQHVPSKIYENDTGAFNAIVYDQFGNRSANNAVTWNSSAPFVFAIDKDTGVYQAKAGGIAVITAASITNPDVSASVTLSVYVPPKPLITGKVSGPTTAYYGVMSDPYIVTSEYASHLNWDFGDGTPTVKTEVNYPYPHWTSSYDTVSHTFVETGELTVELTPSNSYREGETKSFTVHVTYAPPRNLVITDGPTAVVGGESAVYTAFATNADTYTWYLDGQVVEGQTGSVATILFPAEQNERTAEVKVAASYKDSGNCEPVTKTVTVSVAGGVLGEFGNDISMNPAKPAVGDVVVFSIDKVSNAVKYLWTFEDGHTETTTAPKVSYALKDTETDSVTVTAYNSADLSKEKTYTFTAAGAKPAKPVITASKASANAGDTIIFTVASDGAKTYKWVIDGVVQESTTNTCEVFWTVDDVGKHDIAVAVSNDYGTSKNSIVYEVVAKKGKPAIIKKITGPDVMNEQGSETFNANIQCNDDYTIAWYLNGKLLDGETSKHLKLQLSAGDYVLKVVVTTEYEEESSLEKYFKVVSKKDKQKNNKDKNLETPKNAVTPQLVDNSSSGKSAFSTVGSLSLDKDDISKDADKVSIEIAPINPEDLTGFTDEMGSRQNVLMSLEINPTGLKNEKDLSKSAHITFRLLKDDIADPESIQFYRLDTGSGIDQWVRLHKVSCVEDGDYYEFTIATAGMSQFVAAPVSLLDEQEKPAVPTVEITNTTATFNAVTAAEVSYTLATENIGTLRAPVLTKGGLTLTINDVTVEKIIGSTSTKVSAEVLTNGAVSVTGDISDAESLKVRFGGNKLGDGTADGKVDISDAISALRIIAELDKPTDKEVFYLNVYADSEINLDDSILLLRYVAELLDENYVTKV